MERRPTGGLDGSVTHFALLDDLWKYVVVSIPLRALTEMEVVDDRRRPV